MSADHYNLITKQNVMDASVMLIMLASHKLNISGGFVNIEISRVFCLCAAWLSQHYNLDVAELNTLAFDQPKPREYNA